MGEEDLAAAGGPTGPVNNTIPGGVFFNAVIQGRDITVQLPPQVAPALAGLPGASRTFTGRDEHLDRMLEALAPDGTGRQRAELVTVVAGLAGIGKTELVVQTAVRARKNPGWFPGGVLFVDLFGYDPGRRLSPQQALDGWLRALGIPGEHIPAGLQELQQLYRSVLAAYAEQGRRILVIIDNASTEEQARPLLPTDGTTAALVTSRHTLDGLKDALLTDLDVLDDHASATLLDQALRRARGDSDTRVSDDPDAAAAIARLCAGLPLALRIAAAILAAAPARPAASLATALKAEHTRLNRLRRPDRAVRAAFDLSYQLLDDDQARLFRLLPLNPGPDLSTETAAHLGDIDPDTTEELLLHLADAHLVEYGHVWGRWRLHDLVRLFANEHGHTHAAVDQRETAQTRLFTHYQDTAAAADTHMDTGPGTRSLRFDDRSTSLAWLDAEHPSLIATAITAPALGHPHTALALALDLARYLRFRRRFHDWITISTVALTVCRELSDRHREGIVLNNLGLALREVRRFEEAIDVHTQVLDICRELGDQHSEGGALNNLGLALREVRRFEEAVDVHTQGLDICRELGDQHSEGIVLNNLGAALQQVRRFEEAIDAHTEAAAVFRELGDRHHEGQALNSLGLALREVRRFEEAIRVHTEAAAVFRELDDRYNEGQALNNLGLALREVRRFEEAIDAHTQDLDICRELRDRHREGQALNNLGSALREVRRFEEAIGAYAEAAAALREVGDRHREGGVLYNLGFALREVRRFEEAVTVLAQAVDIYRSLAADSGSGDAAGLVRSLLLLAWLGVEAGDGHVPAGTLPALQEAAELSSQLVEQHPAEFISLFRAALQLLAGVLELLGRTWEAEQVRRRLADMDPVEE